MKFQDKVVVITGGSSGIGLAAATLFAEQGAQLVLIGRNVDALATANVAVGGNALTLVADVSQVDDIERVMRTIERAHGGIDVLFANAGMSECPPLADTDGPFFDQLIGTNLKGVFFSFVRALPLLRNGAAAIFTATATHDRGRPGDALYLASKAAVRSLARGFAADDGVIAKRIRVNVVSPGATKTPLTIAAHGDCDVRAYVENMVPLGRWGHVDDIARAVLFLASSDASYINGVDLAVDGGLAQI